MRVEASISNHPKRKLSESERRCTQQSVGVGAEVCTVEVQVQRTMAEVRWSLMVITKPPNHIML